jgi:hypothetical protein
MIPNWGKVSKPLFSNSFVKFGSFSHFGCFEPAVEVYNTKLRLHSTDWESLSLFNKFYLAYLEGQLTRPSSIQFYL